jgi:uncharacterized membrane protein YgdD (TMEM256/DUF423 family)
MLVPMERTFLMLSGIFGCLAVAFGAFGAHGLERMLAEAPDGAKRLEWWHTAAHYHLIHALALGLAAWAASRSPGTAATFAGFAFVAGIVIFSGSLYVMTLTGIRWLGAITPLGGLALIAGWAALAWSAR